MKFTRNFPPKIRVASLLSPVFFPTDIITDGNKTLNVFEARFLSLLMKLLSFKADIIEPVDKEYGRVSKDGSWSGVIGLVHREEADIGFAMITEERLKAVDFSYPYIYDTVTFVTDKPEYYRSYYAVFHPFSFFLWGTVFVSFIIVLLTSYACKINSHRKNSQSLILVIWGVLMENTTKLKFYKLSENLLMTFWIVGSMFITFSYKTVLLSFLTFPASIGIRSIYELSKASESSSFKCSTYNSGALLSIFNNTDIESWNKINQCLKRSMMLDTSMEDFMYSDNYKKAFIGGTNYLRKKI